MEVSAVAFRLISQTKHLRRQLAEERAWGRTESPARLCPQDGGWRAEKAILVSLLPSDSGQSQSGPAAPSDFKERYQSLFPSPCS